jgi:hypothetical protein
VDWDDADTHRRSQPYPFPVTHDTHSGRNLHTFAPLASSPAHPTLVSHGGLPSHMILNPEPHFRPVSSRPADSGNPTNAVRPRSSRGESSNPVHLPLRSTPISAPTDPGSENPPPNPEPRPKNKQRIHVTVSETHGETITALRLTSGGGRPIEPPTSDDSDSGLRSRTPPAASASAHST